MWNCTFGDVKLCPSSKIDFWPYLKWQKMKFSKKFFCEIDLFHFTSFFALDFFLNILAHCVFNCVVIIVVLFRFQSMEHYLQSSSTVSNPKKSLLCIFMVTLNPSNLNILLKKLLFHPKVKKKLCLKYIRLVVW